MQWAPTPSEKRITGRALQRRRQRIWTQDPRCAHCGRVTEYPSGFELDHRVPLHQGGDDVDSNCQVLCAGPDGCHARKTAGDAGRRPDPPGVRRR
ncbi:HNH endonuclease signature motif containing protein [Dyella marensis]|uniref:HNH endonuclease n=1 Tax=Dyella TaxID=231454 RepID=UPI0018CC3B9A